MKKSSLALLSSPALLAAFLASGNPAIADTNSIISSPSQITINNPDTYIDSVLITRTTESSRQLSSDRDDRTNILTSDRVGDLAIQKFGCDCTGCRQATLALFSK